MTSGFRSSRPQDLLPGTQRGIDKFAPSVIDLSEKVSITWGQPGRVERIVAEFTLPQDVPHETEVVVYTSH